jgi:hypothetical protein
MIKYIINRGKNKLQMTVGHSKKGNKERKGCGGRNLNYSWNMT